MKSLTSNSNALSNCKQTHVTILNIYNNISIAMNAIRSAKSALRKEVKALVSTLTTEEKARQSGLVMGRLLTNAEYLKSRRISLYLSMPDEVNTMDVLKHALGSGKECFIPRYDDRTSTMDMIRLWTMEEYHDLPTTPWGIKQHPLLQHHEDAITTQPLDVVIMPGLAFTVDGCRLGRGR
ncbi:hypothetical protein Pcinc_044397, partial [Petrolisthes cinctipes]